MNEPTGNRPRRQTLFVVAGLMAGLGLLLLLPRNRRLRDETAFVMDSDPRLTFATPYRNVRPEVEYSSDEVCARCHPAQAETFRQHPMGRSLAPMATAAAERAGRGDHNPFLAQGFQYLVERRGSRVLHKETRPDAQGRPVYEMAAEVRYALGSGTRGRSYLIDRDGYVFQSPISWYSQKGAWDLAPGYETHNHHFGRMVQTDCLFCHSNRVLPVEGSFNRYQQPVFRGYAIGCERCHGPGELHVARRQRGEPVQGLDDTIVNPRHLAPALREAVCQQCHLQGEIPVVRRGRQLFDYRPGLPLHLFVAVFVRPPEAADNHRAVSQVQQMYASRCFRASQGQLGCISCHDPHVLPAPEERVAYYRSRCLQCHEVLASGGVAGGGVVSGEPETRAEGGEHATGVITGLTPPARRITTHHSPKDNCIACHMPRTGTLNIAHTAETDHRILRTADAVPRAVDGPATGETPLALFHADLADPADGDTSRDLGLALVNLAERRQPDALQVRLVNQALPLLEAALRHAPEDVPGQHARGVALRIRGDREEALAALEAALAYEPRREASLVEAASLAASLERDALALTYWQHALEVNPWSAGIHAALARFLAARRRWDEAVPHCQAALRLDPADLETWLLEVRCYLSLGQQDRARSEFERILRFEPPNQKELERWFSQQLRRPITND